MRCPYCHAKLSNRVLACPSCGGQIKKRRGRLPLSILSFFIVFLAVHICACNIWEVDENNVLQAPAWYAIFLLGISILAAVLTYRFLSPQKISENTHPLSDSPKTSKAASPNYLHKSTSSDSVDPPADHFENTTKPFTPAFSVITSDGEIPELQGDYAKTVFLWAVSSSCPVKGNNEYSRYITYECGIQRPQSYHEEMIRQGYLEEDSVEKAFTSLKASELKSLTAQLGISSSGKKADLVARIIASADQDFIACHKPYTFSLSEKGKRFLAEHDAYIQLHRHTVWGIGWKEYDSCHLSGESFENTIASILCKHAACDTRLFGRLEYHSMYQLMAESGNKKKAIAFLLQVLYIDVSGVCGLESYHYYKEGIYSKSDLESWFSSNITIAPGIIDPISDYAEFYSDSIVDKLYSWKLPVQICSKELFLKIVHSASDGDFNFDSITRELKVAYNQFVNQL